MNLKVLAARFALVFSCGLMAAAPASAQFWQCATYAREISGIDIHGNANTWWGQAAGRYERGSSPRVGAVLAFKPTARMRVGHVAMVSQIVSDREVLLTHANWSRPGRVETNVRAVDVSANNDWSVVKVWYAPQGDLGTSSYPTSGFIYGGDAPAATHAAPDGDTRSTTAMANMTIAAAAKAPVTGGISLEQ
ncbi:CHAP domain-containing protein [Sphingomonas sp. TX0543]|uniref:CHAP domain-containing protein n=1 Tax=unclassified Sphingomonas TaxID=196159 RepID=UPI0010F5F307|nr:CHAP domain-containing protein [Sphingomonas sp. 3P27F8]